MQTLLTKMVAWTSIMVAPVCCCQTRVDPNLRDTTIILGPKYTPFQVHTKLPVPGMTTVIVTLKMAMSSIKYFHYELANTVIPILNVLSLYYLQSKYLNLVPSGPVVSS